MVPSLHMKEDLMARRYKSSTTHDQMGPHYRPELDPRYAQRAGTSSPSPVETPMESSIISTVSNSSVDSSPLTNRLQDIQMQFNASHEVVTVPPGSEGGLKFSRQNVDSGSLHAQPKPDTEHTPKKSGCVIL